MIHVRRVIGVLCVGALAMGSTVLLGSDAAAGPFGYRNLNAVQQRHVSGLLMAELGPVVGPRLATPLRVGMTSPQIPGVNGCPVTRGTNIKVNVNCLNLTDSDLQGRGQAQNEPWIAVDPNN